MLTTVAGGADPTVVADGVPGRQYSSPRGMTKSAAQGRTMVREEKYGAGDGSGALSGITRCCAQLLSARHHGALSGVLDAIALEPAPAFRGFFILPALSELSDEAGFLHLLFEQAQGKLHIVLLHLNDEHGVTSGTPAKAAVHAVWRDSL